jgi:hypothetical protein
MPCSTNAVHAIHVLLDRQPATRDGRHRTRLREAVMGTTDSTTVTFSSAEELAQALRRAEAAHGEHEKRTGERDEDWPAWYAAYMLAEQTGNELPS